VKVRPLLVDEVTQEIVDRCHGFDLSRKVAINGESDSHPSARAVAVLSGSAALWIPASPSQTWWSGRTVGFLPSADGYISSETS
jgi:hypothetical protein